MAIGRRGMLPLGHLLVVRRDQSARVANADLDTMIKANVKHVVDALALRRRF